jgi:hypothetical protein
MSWTWFFPSISLAAVTGPWHGCATRSRQGCSTLVASRAGQVHCRTEFDEESIKILTVVRGPMWMKKNGRDERPAGFLDLY